MSLSADHEVPLKLMRSHPDAVAELARTLFGLKIPDGRVRMGPESATVIKVIERRKDSTYLIGEDPVRLGIVLEVQREWDEKKLYSWPLYHVVTRMDHGCEAAVVVLCESRSLAERYAEPIRLGPDNDYKVFVAALEDLEPITAPEVAERFPEIATLAMLGDAPEAELKNAARVWLEALKKSVTDEDALSLYHHYVVNRVPTWLSRYLEDMMTTMEFRTVSKFAAGYYAEGKAEGKAEGEIEALFTVLGARGLPLSDEQRERIESCTDLDAIKTWLRRAVVVTSADELFD